MISLFISQLPGLSSERRGRFFVLSVRLNRLYLRYFSRFIELKNQLRSVSLPRRKNTKNRPRVHLVDELFGVDNETVIHILDYYHLCENVHNFAKAKFKMNEKKYKPWADKICAMLKDGKGAEVLKMVPKEETYENTVNLHHYISMHLKHINYPQYIADNLFIGSGVIESSNKKIVQARLKQAGMRWNVQSAQNLITLITKYESDLWEKTVVQPILNRLKC